MIRIKNLTKEYGRHQGIHDVSFEIQDGEAFGLLGPKGAGKTTLIGILAGFSSADQGTCSINGKIPGKGQESIVRFTGCLPEHVHLPEELTAVKYLRYVAGLRGIRNLERGLQVMHHFEIEQDMRIGRMRKGQRQMLALACTLVHPMLQAAYDALLMEEKSRGTTMLITSENYSDMERVCSRIGLMRRGVLVNIDDTASMRISRKKTYLVTFQTEMETLRFLRENPGIKQAGPCQVVIQVQGEILPWLQLLGRYQTAGLEMMHQSLEDIFEHFYGGTTHA